MEIKNINVSLYRSTTNKIESINEAFDFAVSETRKRLFYEYPDAMAQSHITLDVGNKGYGLSLINLAHYGADKMEEAAWFEIAMMKDDDFVRDAAGDENSSIFQVRYNYLKKFFASLASAPKASVGGVWVLLKMYEAASYGNKLTREEAITKYKKLYYGD